MSFRPKLTLLPILAACALGSCSKDKVILESLPTIRYEVLSVPVDTTNLDLTAVAFPTPSAGIIGGTAGTLLLSADAGQSWTDRSDQTLGDIHRFHFTSASDGWAVTSTGLWRTQTGGSTWSQAIGIDGNMLDLQFVTPTLAYCAGEGGYIYRTVDGGRTWLLRSDWTFREPVRAISFSSPDTGIAVGDMRQKWVTTDGGQHWWDYESGVAYYDWHDVRHFGGGYVVVGDPETLQGLSVPADGGFYAYNSALLSSYNEYDYDLSDARLPYTIYRIATFGTDRLVAVGDKSIIRRLPDFSQSEHTPWAYCLGPDGATIDATFLDAAFADATTFYAVTKDCKLYRFQY